MPGKVCGNPQCKRTFLYTAKLTTMPNDQDMLEQQVCPYCNSVDFQEEPVIIQQIVQPQVESVYIYDLSTGKQEALDKLLSEGYMIVNRFSKQYHLEKPKSEKKAEVEVPAPEMAAAEAAYAKIPEAQQ